MAKRGVLCTLGQRLVDAGRAAPELADAVARGREAAIRRGTVHELLTLDLTATLERKGIACLPLKGQLLSKTLYGEVGLRGTGDIDLLVDPDDLWAAGDLVHARGYLPSHPPLPRGELPPLHLTYEDPEDELPRVELHWRIHWYEREFARRMLARSTPSHDGARRPDRADELASLFLFYARDGFLGVRQAVDIAAWWDRHGAAVEGRALDPIISAHPELGPSIRAGAAVADIHLGVPSAELLAAAAPRGGREKRAVRMADWRAAGGWDQLGANVSLVDGLLSPPGDLRAFAARQLTAYSAEASTVAHASKTLARFAIAMWHTRRGRTWLEAPA